VSILDVSISYKHSLQQGLAPVTIQSIQLLSLPLLSLQTFLSHAILDNPFLYSEPQIFDTFDPTLIHILDSREDSYQDEQPGYTDSSYSPYEKVLSNIHSSETLSGELKLQLYALHLPVEMESIGLSIIDALDPNGYLSEDLFQLSGQLKTTPTAIEKVLFHIQKFSPSGIGARNLTECLCNQVSSDHPMRSVIVKIIKEDLYSLGKHQFQRLAQKYNLSMKDVQNISDYIRTLDPYPGRAFSNNTQAHYIVPDIIVKKDGHNLYIEILGKTQNILKLEKEYCQMLHDKSVDANAHTYLTIKYQEALQLMQSLELREKTIFRFINFLIDYQKNFFLYGPEFLKALTMQEAANHLQVSISTISRCADGKYVSTSWGTFPLKYFFSKSLSGSDNIQSRESVKTTIAALIASENPLDPLSDQMLCQKMQDFGIMISRRTVAKYRSELGILNHKRRKRYS